MYAPKEGVESISPIGVMDYIGWATQHTKGKTNFKLAVFCSETEKKELYKRIDIINERLQENGFFKGQKKVHIDYVINGEHHQPKQPDVKTNKDPKSSRHTRKGPRATRPANRPRPVMNHRSS